MANGLTTVGEQIEANRMIARVNNHFRAAFFLGFASLASWMPTLTVWLQDQDIAGSHIGYVSAIPWIAMLVIQPIWGVIADKTGKKKCFTIASWASASLFLSYTFIDSALLTIIVITALMSLFNAPILSLLDSMALDHIESHSSLSYSSLRFWGAPGFAAGALLTSILTARFGIDTMFYTSGLFLLLAWIAIYPISMNANNAKKSEISFKGLSPIMREKNLLIFLLILIAVSVAQSSSTFYLTIYLREIGSTPEITGIALAVQALSELPFYFIAAWLLRKTAPANILLVAIFGTALRLFLYSINQNAYYVIAIETLNGISWTLLWISSVEYVNSMVAAQWRTTGQSLIWAAYFGGGAIAGNILAGRLYEIMPMRRVFGINSAFACIAGILALGVFMIFRERPGPLKPSSTTMHS
ncbi:MAG: MFS transporter [Chitinophagaceae bacterium]|nr:MFS transporter [Chitinophagaceae bacterium]